MNCCKSTSAAISPVNSLASHLRELSSDRLVVELESSELIVSEKNLVLERKLSALEKLFATRIEAELKESPRSIKVRSYTEFYEWEDSLTSGLIDDASNYLGACSDHIDYLLAQQEKSPSQELKDRVWHLSDTKTFNALLDRIEVVVTRFYTNILSNNDDVSVHSDMSPRERIPIQAEQEKFRILDQPVVIRELVAMSRVFAQEALLRSKLAELFDRVLLSGNNRFRLKEDSEAFLTKLSYLDMNKPRTFDELAQALSVSRKRKGDLKSIALRIYDTSRTLVQSSKAELTNVLSNVECLRPAEFVQCP